MASASHYERAFEHLLGRYGMPYVAVDQAKRAAFAGVGLKSFDYIVYPPHRPCLLVDVKGRKLDARYPVLPGQTWVTTADVEDLAKWQEVFGDGHLAVFVFAYCVEAESLEAARPAGSGRPRGQGLDTQRLMEFEGLWYSFWVAELAGYRTCMRPRSAKWQTVYVPRKLFRAWALELERYLGLASGRRESGCGP